LILVSPAILFVLAYESSSMQTLNFSSLLPTNIMRYSRELSIDFICLVETVVPLSPADFVYLGAGIRIIQ
jgi:hypothetical protein